MKPPAKRTEALALPGVATSFLDQPGVPVVSLRPVPGRAAASAGAHPRALLPAFGSEARSRNRREAGPAIKFPLCYSVDGGAQRCEVQQAERGEIALGGTCPRSLLPTRAEVATTACATRARCSTTCCDGPSPASPAVARSRWRHLCPHCSAGLSAQCRNRPLRRGDVPLGQVLPLLPALAADSSRHAVSIGLGLATTLRDYVSEAQRATYQSQMVSPFAARLRTWPAHPAGR